MSIWTFIYGRFYDMVRSWFLPAPKSPTEAPAKIDEYSLVYTIKVQPYSVGLYKDPSGKRVIIKTCERRWGELRFHYMENEIRLYSILSRAQERIPKSVREHHKQVSIPKFIDAKTSSSRLVLIIEYIEGENLRFLEDGIATPIEKSNYYFQATEFINLLGYYMDPNDVRHIKTRGVIHTTYTVLLMTLTSLILRPAFWRELLSGSWLYMKSIPILIKNRKTQRLIHRDLHFKNILKTKDGIALIDFEECVFAHPLKEYAITLGLEWRHNKKICLLLQEKILKEICSSEEQRKLFAAFVISFVIHRFGDYLEPYLIPYYKDYYSSMLTLARENI